MNAVVLVPRRADGGHRDRLWTWLARQIVGWGYPIIEGHHDEPGPFSRSLALNRAAAEAGAWDVALLVDADTFVNPHQAHAAVALAGASGAMTVGFDAFRTLSEPGTERILGGFNGSWSPLATGELIGHGSHGPVSSIVAVPRRLWDAMGGFDQRFRGWGFEDRAFAIAAATLGGEVQRIASDAWHLWHPRAARKPEDANYRANRELSRRYRAAAGDPAAVLELIAERDRAEVAA
jgi:hypothetical protein